MNLLTALQKERRTLSDREHTIRTCLSRSKGGKSYECISATLYTDKDLTEAEERLSEVDVAIKAITEHRKAIKLTPHGTNELLSGNELNVEI